VHCSDKSSGLSGCTVLSLNSLHVGTLAVAGGNKASPSQPKAQLRKRRSLKTTEIMMHIKQ
jgi:hypothetical protein